MQLLCLYNPIISFLGLKNQRISKSALIYGQVYNCKYSKVIGCNSNWIIIIFLDNVTDAENYKHINRAIVDGNVMNMSLIIMKVKYGTIDTDDSSCHGYYIIKFSLSLYTLQSYFSIDSQVISSNEMVCEGNYFFPININYCYYDLKIIKSINTIFSLKTICNGNFNIICYDSKDFIELL